jgi:hypothetical protein
VGRDAAGPLQHGPQVHEVPGREGGVAVGEVVLGAPGAGVEIGGAGAGLADPAGVGLGRDGVAEVLEAVQDVHGAVLDPVLVAGEQTAGHPGVEGVLTGVVQQARAGVEPLDDPLHHRAVVTQPDRPAQHQDVGGQHLRVDGRPLVGRPAVLGHVRPHAGGDVVVDRPQLGHGHPMALHDRPALVDQPLGVAGLGGALQGAVDVQGIEAVEPPGHVAGVELLGHGHPPGSARSLPNPTGTRPPRCGRREGSLRAGLFW